MLSAIAGAVIIWIVSATMVVPALLRAGVIGSGPPATGMRTETIQLSCLSPQQAGDIIDPYVRGHGSKYWLPSSGISAITVHGSPAEVDRSRSLIGRFERDPSAACRSAATTLRRTIESVNQAVSDANADASADANADVTPSPGPRRLRGPGLLGRGGSSLLNPDKATTPPKTK
jgi:hypothetical protein